MHRTPPERWLEGQLTARRRQAAAERRKAERRREARRRAQKYSPGPHKRAVVGEVIEDLAAGLAATVWRRGGS